VARANIFLNKNDWDLFEPREMAEFKRDVFHYYRHVRGFPYYSTDKDVKDKEYQKFWSYDFTRIISGDTLRLTQHAGPLLWSYFPHSFEIKSYGRRTPYQVFQDDELLSTAIDKAIRFGNKMSDSRIRGMLRMVNSARAVGNFRPTAAAAIYNLNVNPGETVYDPCAGFGGRLLGAARVGANYIGVEPSTKTYIGLKQIAEDYCPDIETEFLQECAEEYCPAEESIDFVLSRPPYFNREEYSQEKTQSYLKFPDKDEWLQGFLARMMSNVYRALKPGKFFALNVHNYKHFKDFEERSLKIAKEVGFVRRADKDMRMILSPLMGAKKFRKEEDRYEPIYFLEKTANDRK